MLLSGPGVRGDLSGPIKTKLRHRLPRAHMESIGSRTHTHIHVGTHSQKQREKGKRSFQMTIHPPSSQVTGTNFPKQHFHLSFSPLWLLRYLEACHMFPSAKESL